MEAQGITAGHRRLGEDGEAILSRLILALAALIVIAGCGSGVDTDVPGYTLAFVRPEGPGIVGLWRLDADDSGETRTCDGLASDGKVAFSPDGSRVAMVVRRDGQLDILGMNAHGGGGVRWLTDDPADDGDPSFSRDGSRIVFCSKRDGHAQIYVMNSDGSGETRVATSPGPTDDDTAPAFSWDGSEITFASTRDNGSGYTHIYVMNADGSGARQLTSGDGTYDTEPSFSPDDRQIVYASSSALGGDHDIWAVKSDGSHKVALTSDWGDCRNPSYSPDGWTIMFSSDRRTVDMQVWMMRTDGTGRGRITEWGGAYPAWIDD